MIRNVGKKIETIRVYKASTFVFIGLERREEKARNSSGKIRLRTYFYMKVPQKVYNSIVNVILTIRYLSLNYDLFTFKRNSINKRQILTINL